MATMFKMDLRQLVKLAKSFTKSDAQLKKDRKRVLTRIGVLIQGVARSYCPESPTIGQYARANKRGVTNRKRSGVTTGSLRDSIRHDVGGYEVSINVPANSRGGKYAERIHDEKGKSWRNRGARTIQKGAKADEKFIYRAYDDRKRDVDVMVDDLLDNLIKNIGV